MHHKYKIGDIVHVCGPKEKMGRKEDCFGIVGRVKYVGCVKNWYLLDKCANFLDEEWLEPYEEDEDINPEDLLTL